MPSLLASVMNFPRPLTARRLNLFLLYIPFLAVAPFVFHWYWVVTRYPRFTPPPSPLGLLTYQGLTVIYLISAAVAIAWNYRRLI